MMSGSSLWRRRFLTLVGGSCIGAVAGCSGGNQGGGETPTETPTPSPSSTQSPTPTPTTPNQEAVEHYEAAIEVLVQNKETLDEWAESSYEASEVGTLQERVSTARDELDEAEESADRSGELMVQIQQAGLVADFQELSLAYYEGVTVLLQIISDASTFGDSEQHQRAADKFAEGQQLLEDVRGVLDDMGAALDQIDNEALNEPDLEYTGEPLDHLDLGDRAALDGVDRYLEGFENIHLAFVQLEQGQAHFENEAFTDAREDWETGRSRAQTSISSFEAVVDISATPENFRNQSIQLIETAETVVEAYDKLIEGAEEAEAGNVENATTLVREGFEILGQI